MNIRGRRAGFTFSFPMRQHSISSGELLTWTKSFCCGGMRHVDVAALLQRCLDARGLKVTVQVLLNDTTGTLVAGAQRDPDVGVSCSERLYSFIILLKLTMLLYVGVDNWNEFRWFRFFYVYVSIALKIPFFFCHL